VAYRKLFDSELDSGTISEIRNAANTGLALGNDRFRKQVELLTGQRQNHLKRCPKPKPNLGKEFLL
jgi:putative transposase